MGGEEGLERQPLLREVRSLERTLAGDSGPHEVLAEGPFAGLAARFDLTPFERALLVLCAGCALVPEMEDALGRALSRAEHGTPQRSTPTFGAALAVLPNPHWSALLPTGPLRRWSMLRVEGPFSLHAPLRIDERALHAALGVQSLDPLLWGWVQPPPTGRSLDGAEPTIDAVHPLLGEVLVQLVGPDPEALAELAAVVIERGGGSWLRAYLPGAPTADIGALVQALSSETLYSGISWWIDADDLPPERVQFLQHVLGVGLLTTRQRIPLRGPRGAAWVAVELGERSRAEQAVRWREVGAPSAVAEHLAGAFSLSGHTIARLWRNGPSVEAVWRAAIGEVSAAIDGLAERLPVGRGWDELVLPDDVTQDLRDFVALARVPQERPRSLIALLEGPSGAGKTLAAEIIAGELGLALYRVDLSRVVDKYIGETEKHLARLFDAAEHGGILLLFDEADALFGARSEVRDSHDRYANLEVSYLLQRIERHRGPIVLTTNRGRSIDAAFARRLLLTVRFPALGAAERAKLWARWLGPYAPTPPEQLATLELSGANIENVGRYALGLAAAEGLALNDGHLMRAVRVELVKLDRPVAEADRLWEGGSREAAYFTAPTE